MNILVTGANGQVGMELRDWASHFPAWNFIFVGHSDLDISNQSAIAALFEQYTFQYCINCAAYTAVDKAESDSETAFRINARAVELLAKACTQYHTTLVHLSTDYVYHNQQNTPFVETDITNPQSVYAQSKLEGDRLALEHCKKSIVLRTSWVYSFYGANFVKTMLRLGKERPELRVLFDQIGTPTYARDLAEAILQIITFLEAQTSINASIWGIYHYSNEGVCSWYDFALAIFELSNYPTKVQAILTKEYPTPAQRPPFSVLNKGKLKQTFGIAIPHWRSSLQACLKRLTQS